jgi:hypothetical protein
MLFSYSLRFLGFGYGVSGKLHVHMTDGEWCWTLFGWLDFLLPPFAPVQRLSVAFFVIAWRLSRMMFMMG